MTFDELLTTTQVHPVSSHEDTYFHIYQVFLQLARICRSPERATTTLIERAVVVQQMGALDLDACW